jgi:CubicO group peptidase (beta-lactamase class C family)
MPSEKLEFVRAALKRGVRDGTFSGAALLAAREGQVIFQETTGYASRMDGDQAVTKETIFDLASLTKPLATALSAMKLVDQNKIDLDQSLADLLHVDIPLDKAAITPRLLLCHGAGLIDWQPFYEELINHPHEGRKGLMRTLILATPLKYEPGEGSHYSDLGFILLEWIIEEVSGMTLPQYVGAHFYQPLSLNMLSFSENNRPKYPEEQYAATEDCPWRGKVLRGVVHDDNAYAVGGYSGHAGLFGTALDCYSIVNLLREHYHGLRKDYLEPSTVQAFFTRQDITKESTWALGWDTPSKTGSSAGRYFSEESVGHLGFTGTSVWMDLKKNVIVVLLTNRVHPARVNEKIKAFRPQLHDVIMKAIF